MYKHYDSYYAHSLEGRPASEWHLLEDHLMNTSRKAAEFAEEFSSAEWGKVLGLWHDLGKYLPEFQDMLIQTAEGKNSGHPDHSTPGAIYSLKKLGKLGTILAYVIAGHHTGLPDWQSEKSGASGLAYRLQKTDLYEELPLNLIPQDVLSPHFIMQKPLPGLDPAFWIRILYSCLVDADFLDTEAFLQPDKYTARASYPDIPELLVKFNAYMEEKALRSPDTTVNRLRKQILQRCVDLSSGESGIYTLEVPTGGGKTLSSMAFALNHAVKHRKKRIIYVIPYTSIIEQTADQFRRIFGEVVIEHHSNLDVGEKTSDSYDKHSLACENWDAPVIVTTTVQFFESLFSNRSSRCRKLHNIVNSIVVLDEAQLLPPEYLIPILKAVRELSSFYKTTFVFSTATQPAFDRQEGPDFKFEGLPGMKKIIENPQELNAAFKRVQVIIPTGQNQPVTWETLAGELTKHPSVLCIVNRRDDARHLYQLMPEDTIHLSALMCGAHRSKVIDNIKDRLQHQIPTRVISTQLVEAGVDVDFPVVYRALAGLDSIAQAAGRCNREGNLERGYVVVFIPPSEIPAGHLRQAAEIGVRLLSAYPDDPLAFDNYKQFFKELYWLKGEKLDAYGIISALTPGPQLQINYRLAAAKFHLIDDSLYRPVLVRYEDGNRLIELLRRTGPERWLMRRLQRYVVNIPFYVHSQLLKEESIKEIFPGIFIQDNASMYDPVLGFCSEKSLIYRPDDLFI